MMPLPVTIREDAEHEDGTGFLRALREADAEVPVLVLTVVGDRDSHERALWLRKS